MRPNLSRFYTLLILLVIGLLIIPIDKSGIIKNLIDRSQDKQTTNPLVLEIPLGTKGDDVIKQSGLRIKKSKVASLLFFDASPDITGATLPVMIKTREKSLSAELPAPDSILFDEQWTTGLGIDEITLTFKMPKKPADITNHEEVFLYDKMIYDLTTRVIKTVSNAGWKRYIPLEEPRIAGKFSYHYLNPISSYVPDISSSSDPNYLFTFEEWRGFSDTNWKWHANDTFISLEYVKTGRDNIGFVDLLELKATTDHATTIGFDPKNNSDWDAALTAYKAYMPHGLKTRHEEEIKAIAIGVPILRDWKDPEISGVPVPPSLDSN